MINNPAPNLPEGIGYVLVDILNHTVVIACFGIACLIAAACAGCVGVGPGNPAGQVPSPTPAATAVPVGHLVVTEEQNNATVSVARGNTITVRLLENPTTGFVWNLTTTPGLQVMDDSYVPSDTTGKLVGSGGTRVWNISAASPGEQKIHAMYRRSWEQATGSEPAFSLTVVVV
jgi:inhibitor of cysteine peptidase